MSCLQSWRVSLRWGSLAGSNVFVRLSSSFDGIQTQFHRVALSSQNSVSQIKSNVFSRAAFTNKFGLLEGENSKSIYFKSKKNSL